MFHMRRAVGVLQQPGGPGVLLFAGLYCLWSGISLFWTEDANLDPAPPALTFILLLDRFVGLGAGFYA